MKSDLKVNKESTQPNNLFTIWIDADSCPVQVREVIIRASMRLDIPAIFVANRSISLPKNKLLSMIVSEATPDAADNIIVEKSMIRDIVITRDIPLANRLVEKKVRVINDRGIVYDEENIRQRLSIRNFNLELFNMGLVGEKSSSFGKKELQNFANCFDRELQKKIKNLRK
ncbi:MAG: hypothetical protein BKP49_04980 [Treponema sp. CETP13]|nr:MAG: hypothetical protein BKP49_04980 [Treponema sp. CETP13]